MATRPTFLVLSLSYGCGLRHLAVHLEQQSALPSDACWPSTVDKSAAKSLMLTFAGTGLLPLSRCRSLSPPLYGASQEREGIAHFSIVVQQDDFPIPRALKSQPRSDPTADRADMWALHEKLRSALTKYFNPSVPKDDVE